MNKTEWKNKIKKIRKENKISFIFIQNKYISLKNIKSISSFFIHTGKYPNVGFFIYLKDGSNLFFKEDLGRIEKPKRQFIKRLFNKYISADEYYKKILDVNNKHPFVQKYLNIAEKIENYQNQKI